MFALSPTAKLIIGIISGLFGVLATVLIAEVGKQIVYWIRSGISRDRAGRRPAPKSPVIWGLLIVSVLIFVVGTAMVAAAPTYPESGAAIQAPIEAPIPILTSTPEVLTVRFQGKDNYKQNSNDPPSPDCKNEDPGRPSFEDYQAVYSFIITNNDPDKPRYITSIKAIFKLDPVGDEAYSIDIPERKSTTVFEGGVEHMRASGYFYGNDAYGFAPCIPSKEAVMPYELPPANLVNIPGHIKVGLLFDYLRTPPDQIFELDSFFHDEVFEFHFSDGSFKVINLPASN